MMHAFSKINQVKNPLISDVYLNTEHKFLGSLVHRVFRSGGLLTPWLKTFTEDGFSSADSHRCCSNYGEEDTNKKDSGTTSLPAAKVQIKFHDRDEDVDEPFFTMLGYKMMNSIEEIRIAPSELRFERFYRHLRRRIR